MSNTPDLQSAIERARAVAAKLSSQLPAGSPSQKRPLDSSDGPSANKKFASVDDAVGANLAMLKAQQNGMITEEMKVPDKMVGLVIGKGGSQLHQLQDETGCKVAIAPSSNNGQTERSFTISGRDRQAIQQCKKRIDEIIKRGQTGGSGGGGGGIEVMEMLIPGNKCGIVIGKGGETIKRLNEEYGVKMILIQDADTPLHADKPLRISGEADRVARVKDAIMELINPPPQQGRGGGGGYRGGGGDDRGEYGSRRGGGDRYDDGGRSGKGGGRDDRYGGGGGAGGAYGAGGGGAGGAYGKDPMGSSSPYSLPQCVIRVPGDRAGFVIGKGGETIKDINRRSGAHVEIDKASRDLPNGADKHFNIRGLPEQIQFAQQLIYEKITGIPGAVPPAGYFGPGSEVPGGFSQNLWAQSDPNTAAWAAYYQQYYGQMATGVQPAASTSATDASKGGAATAAAAAAASGGQTDYSQQWIEYYRSLGMHEQADAILKQIQQNQAGGGGGQATNGAANEQKQATNGNGSSAAGVGSNSSGGSSSDYNQWQNYQQQQQQYNKYSNYNS